MRGIGKRGIIVRMTRQKFYELCVRKTLELAEVEEESPFHGFASVLGADLREASFDELCMRAQLSGLDLPNRQNFRKWGVRYLCQLLAFAHLIDDYGFTMELFRFLSSNRSLYSGKRDDLVTLGDACYDLLLDSIPGKFEFATELSSFIFEEFRDSGVDWIDDWESVAYAFGLLRSGLTKEWFEWRRERTEKSGKGAEDASQGR